VVLTRRETIFSSTVTSESARVKEATKKGKQKWHVDGLLADEVQPGGPRLLAKRPRRENGPTGGEKLGQEDEAEEAGADEVADEVEKQAE